MLRLIKTLSQSWAPLPAKKALDQRSALGRSKCDPSNVWSPSSSGAINSIPSAAAMALQFLVSSQRSEWSVKITHRCIDRQVRQKFPCGCRVVRHDVLVGHLIIGDRAAGERSEPAGPIHSRLARAKDHIVISADRGQCPTDRPMNELPQALRLVLGPRGFIAA